jgi:hypothetical protein
MSQPAYQYPPPQPVVPAQPVATRRVGVFGRLILTLVGAGLIILGGFMDWIRGIPGVDISWQAFWRTTFSTHTSTFLETVGFVVIVIGLLAILGLSPRSGWLTRFAGALGIVAFVLFAIELVRLAGGQAPGVGAWVTLIGSVVALVGGFLGTRTVVTAAPARAVAAAEPEI